jgi:hypothetical protein
MLVALSSSVVLLGVAAYFAFAGGDAWPFASYPMFAPYETVNELRVYRLAFLTANGDRVWWVPEFPDDGRNFGIDLARILSATDAGTKEASIAWDQLIGEIAWRIALERNNARYSDIALVARMIGMQGDTPVTTHDVKVASAPLAEFLAQPANAMPWSRVRRRLFA